MKIKLIPNVNFIKFIHINNVSMIYIYNIYKINSKFIRKILKNQEKIWKWPLINTYTKVNLYVKFI